LSDSLLYIRSAYINSFLVKKNECIVTPLNSKTLKVENGPVFIYIHLSGRDVIDYEEIAMHCQKLFLPIPGQRDLQSYVANVESTVEFMKGGTKKKKAKKGNDRRRLG
jgi:hypothetical protein